ncbi:lasso RiPP family leader peptide-containing protein [Streptomyces sparsogenes]
MDAKMHYEAPALFEIGGFSEKTRWVNLGWIYDFYGTFGG